MAESNPLIEAIRRLATMIAAKPDVQLVRADPESPAKPAAGWVLHVGRHRIDLSPPPVDDRGPTVVAATAAGYAGGITVSRSGRTVTATSTTLAPPSSDWSALVLELPTWATPHTTTWAAAVATGNGAVGVAEFAQTNGRMYITAARWSAAPTGVIAFSATWLATAGS